MKAIRKASYRVVITNSSHPEHRGLGAYYWTACTESELGLSTHCLNMGGYVESRKEAVEDWELFAKLNGIKNHTIQRKTEV